MESKPEAGGLQRAVMNVRVKPLGCGNSDSQSLIDDGKARSKRYTGANDTEIIIGDVDTKKKPSVYKFDNVIKDDTSQLDAFNQVMPENIQNFMDGYNVCYAAYGQTGSGKTHTVTGPPNSFKTDPETEEAQEHYGLFPRTCIDVWKKIQGSEACLTVSLFEDYCAMVKDMSTGKTLKVDPGTNEPYGYVEHKLTTFQDIIAAARIVETKRAIAETKMNATSSRSHAMMRITLYKKDGDKTRVSFF